MKKSYAYVVLTGIISGLIVFSGQVFADLGLSLYQIATIPYLATFVVLTPLVIFKPQYRAKPGIWPILLVFGLSDAIVTLAQFSSVILGVPVAITLLLLYSQPLWTILVSYFFLHQKITAKNILTCALVLIGVIILINPFHLDGQISLVGLTIAAIGGLGMTGWVMGGSEASKHGNHPVNSLFWSDFALLAVALASYPLVRTLTNDHSLVNFSFNIIPMLLITLIVFGLVTQLANHLFYLKGTQKVPTVDAGVIMLLEPVIGAILAAIFLHQPLTSNIIIGGILILFANYLVITQNSSTTLSS